MITIRVFFLIILFSFFNSCKDNNFKENNKSSFISIDSFFNCTILQQSSLAAAKFVVSNPEYLRERELSIIKKKCVRIDFDQYDFYYKEFKNYLRLKYYDSTDKNLIVKFGNKNLKRISNFYYEITYDKSNPGNRRVEIYKKIDSDTVLIGQKGFRWFNLYNVRAGLGTNKMLRDTTINKRLLLYYKELSARCIEHYYNKNIEFLVLSFTLSGNINGLTKEYHSLSNKFTKEQKQIFSNLKSGDKIYFENIKVKGIREQKYIVPPIMFKIK